MEAVNELTGPEPTGLAYVAELRRATYLAFGAMFLYPGAEHLEEVARHAKAMRREGDLARDFPFFPLWDGILSAAESLGAADAPALESEYIDLFQAGKGRVPCPPYESAYADRTGRLTGWVVSQVESSYAAAGMALSEAGRGEMPDHFASELEFMSILCEREAEARERDAEARERDAEACEQGAGGDVVETLTLEKAFLDQHLGRFFPVFARRVDLAAREASIYRKAAAAARAFIVHDSDMLDVLTACESDGGLGRGAAPSGATGVGEEAAAGANGVGERPVARRPTEEPGVGGR